jgi:hypothetical protein
MSDGFAEMIPRAVDFFRRLGADNTKAFYEAHKDFYTAEIRKPAELMADLFAEDLARHTGKPHGPKVFRIHRDVRFSKDKTPYNTHLHLMWSRPGDALAPAWFFGAARLPDLRHGRDGAGEGHPDPLPANGGQDGDDLTDAMATAEGQTSPCRTGAPTR